MVGVSKIVKSQIESNSQPGRNFEERKDGCVKDRQITNWKQFTTHYNSIHQRSLVCQRSSNHKLRAIYINELKLAGVLANSLCH